MNFNFKNLSENTKRIRIIPKNGAELFANIGVDNPTAMTDEDGVFSVCLSPNETPTCAWLRSSDFSGVIDSWMPSNVGDTDALAYMDSLQQFNSTIDQIQSIKVDYFEPIEQDNILSIDYSMWIDAIKAEAKQQVSDPAMPFQVFVTEDYLIEDMNTPQPIMDAINALSPYIEDTVYYARVSAYIMIHQTVENQYVVDVTPSIDFSNQDWMPLRAEGVTEVTQVCFKGGNIAAFKMEHVPDSPAPNFLKQPESVLSLNEGTKWLRSQGGFTSIYCRIPLL